MTGPEKNAVELNWDAFRYIADEMKADERDAFEEQLATDQLAREAVAEVVELSQSVVLAAESAPAVETSTVRGSRWAPIGWMSMGAALCLAVMLTLRPATPQVPSVAANKASPELAERWVSSGQVTATEEAQWHAPAPVDSLDPVSAVVSDTAESDIPTWLMAAVSVRKDDPTRNEN